MKLLKTTLSYVCCVCLLAVLFSGCQTASLGNTIPGVATIKILKDDSEIYKKAVEGYIGTGQIGDYSSSSIVWEEILSEDLLTVKNYFFGDFTIIKETDYAISEEELNGFNNGSHFFLARIDKVYAGTANVKVGDEVILVQRTTINRKTKADYADDNAVLFKTDLQLTCRVEYAKNNTKNGEELEYFLPITGTISHPITVDRIEYLCFKTYGIHIGKIDAETSSDADTQIINSLMQSDGLYKLFTLREIKLSGSAYQYIQDPSYIDALGYRFIAVVNKKSFEKLVKECNENRIKYDYSKKYS